MLIKRKEFATEVVWDYRGRPNSHCGEENKNTI